MAKWSGQAPHLVSRRGGLEQYDNEDRGSLTCAGAI